MQINFQAMDVNKYRYIQTPIGLLIFEVIGHVYAVQSVVMASLCSRGDWFESSFFRNPEDMFCRVEAHIKVDFLVVEIEFCDLVLSKMAFIWVTGMGGC